MKLSIIIPVYNEEKTVIEVIEKTFKAELPKNVLREVVVVDDGSTDKSKLLINAVLKKHNNLYFIEHKSNRGKGAAIRTGISKATGDIILIQDADLEYDPNYYGDLIMPIVVNKAKVVYGNRFASFPFKLNGDNRTPLPLHYIANKSLTFLTNFLYGSNISDMETGYKAFSDKIIKNIKLTCEHFDFEPEVTAKILKQGVAIVEVPIKANPRTYKEGKKITWRDALTAVWILIKFRLID